MSGFWDAIGRAAFGQPGTAVPRPRSMFEPEASDLPVGDLDAGNTEVDAAPDPDSGSAHAISSAQALDAAPGPERRLERVEAAPAPDDSKDHERETPEPLRAVTRLPEPSPPAPSREPERAPEDPKTLRTVERVEIHRLETTHLVSASPATPPEEDRPLHALKETAAQPVVAEAREAKAITPPEMQSGAIDRPIAVVAEPIEVATEPPALAQELPPLVIEIDRIDIRIESQTAVAPQPSRRREATTVPSLHEYLGRQSGAPR